MLSCQNKLINTDEIQDLYKFKLMMLRGSRDGFTSNKCDNQSHTVSIVKSER